MDRKRDARLECKVCWYVYDPAAGDPVWQVAPGTAFDDLPHPTRPFYTGKPWFLPAAVTYYRWVDQLQHRAAMARS